MTDTGSGDMWQPSPQEVRRALLQVGLSTDSQCLHDTPTHAVTVTISGVCVV